MRWETLILPLVFFFANGQIESTNCEGGFDVYMIIDQSNSVNADGRLKIANLTAEMVLKYQSAPGFRMAIYTFGSVAFPVLPLTADLTQVNAAIAVMKANAVNSGFTQMEKGMEFAVNEMTNPENANRNKMMFLLTDGQMTSLSSPPEQSSVAYWANAARSVRCTVISVGIGAEERLDIALLKEAANKPSGPIEFYFNAPDFDDLLPLLDQFSVGTDCVNLTALLRDCGPLFAYTEIIITAVGMTAQSFYVPEVTDFSCSFQWTDKNETRNEKTTAAFNPVSETLVCLTPNEDIDVTTNVQVFFDNNSFAALIPLLLLGSQHPGCLPVVIAPTPFPVWLPILLLLLFLFLLWFFFPKVPGKKTFEDPTEEFNAPQLEETMIAPIVAPVMPLPPPKLPPPAQKKKIRKWAKVDTSHYIWARDGGTARPMEVAWGGTGAPESAPCKAGEVEYTVQKTAAAVVVDEPVHQPILDDNLGTDWQVEESDFEEIEWNRCCCGLCSMSACSFCKSLGMGFVFCCGATGNICSRGCGPCSKIYNMLDHCRPRWDCCGVKKGGGGDEQISLNPIAHEGFEAHD